MPSLSFDKATKIITVLSPDTEITCQELYDLVRDWEDETINIEEPTVIRGAGKEELGGSVYVGITVTLIDWYITFEELPNQCAITGGNLVRYDTTTSLFTRALDPSAPAVYVTASSSATLQEQAQIEYGSFLGRVTIDAVNGYAGTEFPIGTPQEPVNNLADAITIAQARGFDVLYIVGDFTIGATDNVDGYIIEGIFPSFASITIVSGASTEGTLFRSCTVSGTLDGDASIRDCSVCDLEYVEGNVCGCCLAGTITLAGSTPTRIHDCWDGLPGETNLPVINMGGSGRSLTVAGYHGDLYITNKTGSDDLSIDISVGHVELDSTITAGSITVKGIGTLVDNTGGTATVDSTALLCKATIASQLLDLSYIEDTMTLRKTLRLMAAILGGKVSGVGTDTVLFTKAPGGTDTRITATVDAIGNRTNVTYSE